MMTMVCAGVCVTEIVGEKELIPPVPKVPANSSPPFCV